MHFLNKIARKKIGSCIFRAILIYDSAMMLHRLTIEHIVLIEKVTLSFERGLTVFTGETGAGKSILLDALGLVLGARADASLVRHGQDAARVSAEWDIHDRVDLQAWLQEEGIEADSVLLVRRVLKKDGTSKAWINDHPVTVKLLKNLAHHLVALHGQHDQRMLGDAGSYRDLLDAYAGALAQRRVVADAYHAWSHSQTEREKLHQQLAQAERERDYMEHVCKELTSLAPQQGEEDELTQQRIAMVSAEKRLRAVREASEQLNGASPIASQLARTHTLLLRSEYAEEPHIAHALDALDRCLNELAEAETHLEQLLRHDHHDARAQERTEDRLFALKDMARKYRTSCDGLVELWQDARSKITALQHSTASMNALDALCAQHRNHYLHEAEILHQMRLSAIDDLCHAVHEELAPLKMQATRFRVQCVLQEEACATAHGLSEVVFEISPNAGTPFASLGAIASGGELSRFMLALAVVMRRVHPPHMMIFDEIDTGTGGAVAEAIGERLARLGQQHQVAVVTHLPQVAAQGTMHYHIRKTTDGNQTTTHVTRLSEDERHEEIARMLSGARITQEARHAAARLLAHDE
ncbi:MAG: DNA repair protein RecN [Alphaproteobacteria bacterium]|nr:MAG: DNA repair protein RecN [Alphaproteobacteria bacterium]